MTDAAGNTEQQTADSSDWLGYGVYADTLWDRVKSSFAQPGAKSDVGTDPLVIGVFGEWGAGKSKLLELIHARAKKQSDDDCKTRAYGSASDAFTLTVPVWFHPWKYEHEAHLGVPLLMHIQEALSESLLKAATPLEELIADSFKLKKWFWQTTRSVHEKADSWSKIISHEFLQLGVGAAVGTLFTPAAGIAATAGVKWLASAGESVGKATKFGEKATPPPPKAANDVPLINQDGNYYYKTHQLLRKLTRIKPLGKDKNSEIKGLDQIRRPIHINFVVFVDDLDRCLPEKAVQVLELIKTLVNVESFAFVLALDDEVIERGISHRYQAYQLAGKKPEMPITGFEYLEKIVHVPFRLPALTYSEAMNFVTQLEARKLRVDKVARPNVLAWNAANPSDTRDLPAESQGPWFRQLEDVDAAQVVTSRVLTSEELEQLKRTTFGGLIGPSSTTPQRGPGKVDLNLGHFALFCFDAYVPRKLARLVELFYQVEAVASARGNGRTLEKRLGGSIDVRVVLCLLMLQLFQPELYRVLRRSGSGLGELFAAFMNADENGFVSPVSDVELLRWASFQKRGPSVALDALPQVIPTTVAEAYATVGKLLDDPGQRYPALQVRLPVVACLLEHRKVQRHAFDPMKLFRQLAQSAKVAPIGESGDNILTERDARRYFSLLSLTPDDAKLVIAADGGVRARVSAEVVVPGVSASYALAPAAGFGTPSVQHRSRDIEPLFLAMVREGNTERAILEAAGVEANQTLDIETSAELENRLRGWLDEPNRSTQSSTPDSGRGVDPEARRRAQTLLGNLLHIAPILPPSSRRSFWNLVKDCVKFPDPIEPKLRALWGDVRCALGCDDRFDPNNFYLLKERFEDHDERIEPIPGFALVPAGEFVMGHAAETDNQPRKMTIAMPFYISRTLVTVDQFALFFEGKDAAYVNKAFWDVSSAAWRKEHPAQSRIDEMSWSEQRRYGSRPASSVSWFEARAYARWLSAQLRPALERRGLRGNYEVMLPTETQWERAARASTLTAADERRWPWQGDDSDIDQRANVNESIDSASAVGLYSPNPIGLYDMAGNVWEWMDNSGGSGADVTKRVPGNANEVDSLSLRGGSWFDSPGHAACVCRLRYPPDERSVSMGFRVVLSLAENES